MFIGHQKTEVTEKAFETRLKFTESNIT